MENENENEDGLSKTMKSVAETIFSVINDPENPYRMLVESLHGYWINQGYDPDQARYLVMKELGWSPPKGWRDFSNDG